MRVKGNGCVSYEKERRERPRPAKLIACEQKKKKKKILDSNTIPNKRWIRLSHPTTYVGFIYSQRKGSDVQR